MFDIDAKLAEIRRELGEDSATKINSHLKELEMEYRDKLDTISSVNNESKTRKLKLREYEEKLAERDAELEKLRNDDSIKAIKAENERLKKLEMQVIQEKKQKLLAKLSQISAHADFEKLKKAVEVPEPVDGKYNLDTVEAGKVDAILAKIDEYSELGLFAQNQQRTGGNGQNFVPNPQGKYYGYNSPVELQQKDPEKYKLYRKARGFA